MLKLWGRDTSSNVMKVIWLLEELGLPYERIDAGLAFGRTNTAEYRAMNPLGVVPSLEDGDLALFESNAIMRYLTTAYAPDNALFPADPRARAPIDAWLDFQQTALSRPQSLVFQGLVRTPEDKRDWTAIKAAITDAGRVWGILDSRLAHQTYVATHQFSLADIAFGVHAHRWINLDIPGKQPLVHLQAWYDTLLARPAYAQHVARPIV